MTRPPRDVSPIRLTVRIARQTAMAVLVYQSDADEAVWLPRSQITRADDTGQTAPNGHPLWDITLPKWLATQNRLHAVPPAGPDLFGAAPAGGSR